MGDAQNGQDSPQAKGGDENDPMHTPFAFLER